MTARTALTPVSFDDLYQTWREQVSRWVRSCGARAVDVDDLVQEVFIVASRGLARFDGGNPAGWLFNISWRKVRDYRRSNWNRCFFTRNRVEISDDLSRDSRHPLRELEMSEASKVMDRSLATLGIELRETLTLFVFEGYSGEEIATLQRIPVNTVWARLHRARIKLRSRKRWAVFEAAGSSNFQASH